jgi:hypothetical protein
MEPNVPVLISEIVAAFGIIGALSVNYYKVKVHHRVLFGDKGELNFATPQQLEKFRHDTCPVHIESMDLIKSVKNIQVGNIQRMDSFEEAMREAVKAREKHQEMLGAVSTQLATLIANSVHMASDIKELKEQVKA